MGVFGRIDGAVDYSVPPVAPGKAAYGGGTIASSDARDVCARVKVCSWPIQGAGTEFDDQGKVGGMAGKTDQVKGRAKEAVGDLTGDKDLKSEGKADRRAGEAKEKLDDAKDKVQEVIDKADDKVEEVMDKAKDALHRK
jgi:uncharacterized protein YjbJ (UPF0337 family)